MPFKKGSPKPPNSGRRRKPDTPQLTIQYWPLSRLKPYERNPQKNDKAVGKMQASIREYGFAVPVLARSSGEVIDGHLRLKGATAEGMEQIPVILCDGWTDAQVKAFRLMANRSVNWADWDMDALALEFGELKELEFDMSLTGFEMREIDALTLFASDSEDDVPAPPEDPVSKLGDLYALGGHRLLCGDSTVAENAAALLGTEKPMLMVTDPPYGVEYDANWRNETVGMAMGKSNRATGKVENDARADWRQAWALFPGEVAYVWCASLHSPEVAASLQASNFNLRSLIIWDKARMIIGRGNYHWQHEPCWYAVKIGGKGHWTGDRTQTTVWQIKHQKSETGHSTQKPVECMRRPILNHTKPGDSVYDPFLGSGTTLIAAEATERRCFGMELNPAYVDVILARWEKFTGKKAEKLN